MSLDRYFPPPKFPCALEEEEKEKSERENKPEMEISRLWKKRSVLEVGRRGEKYRKTKPDTGGGGGGGHPPRLSLPLQKISVISLAPPSLLSRLKFQEYSKRPGNANAMPDQKEGLSRRKCVTRKRKGNGKCHKFPPLVFRAIQIFFSQEATLSLYLALEVTAKASDFEPPPSRVARFFP